MRNWRRWPRPRTNAHVVLFSALAIVLAGCQASGGAANADPRLSSESEMSGWRGVSTGPPAEARIAEGRRIAERHCAACHAIDGKLESPNPAAPTLRDVLAVNDPDYLAYRFIDAMRVGHSDMPVFDLDISAAESLIAYLESIS